MKKVEAIKIAKLCLKCADNFYAVQKTAGVKFTKGRLKFRKDVKEAIKTLIDTAEEPKMKELTAKKLAKIVAKTLDGMVLWSVWCNHYEDQRDYDRWMKRDLKEFSGYIAEAVLKELKVKGGLK